MNKHIFSSIQQTCAPFPVMKHNVPHCSLMADSQSLVSWLGQLSSLAAPAAQSCMLIETQEVQGLLINSLTIDRCIKTATISCLYSVKLLWGGCQYYGVNIGNDLAPTGSVSNTVWNILGEFQRSEARCTKPQWKDLPVLVILFPPSVVYMRRLIGSPLIRVMVSRLFGAKPLPELVLTYNQLDPWEQTSVKL